MQDLKRMKRAKLVVKHKTYLQRANLYNNQFHPNNPIPTPDLKTVEVMSLTDIFWAGGELSHPEKQWASDMPTREGIQAFLDKRGADEELQRISREARQLLQWAILHQSRLDLLKSQIPQGDFFCHTNPPTPSDFVLKLLMRKQAITYGHYIADSQKLQSTYGSLGTLV